MDEFRNPARLERAMTRIEEDRRSGASELALRAVRIFGGTHPSPEVSPSRYTRAVHRLARQTCGLRPTMSPIRSAVTRLILNYDRAAAGAGTALAAHQALVGCARELSADLAGVGTEVARLFHRRFGRLHRPMLLSYSSRVNETIGGMKEARVTVCESRPLLEGRRTAKILVDTAHSVVVITEAQVLAAMQDCDSVIFGCDTVYPDGSVVNKMGSRLLALAAEETRRPVIVLADTYKLAEDTYPLEDHAKTQVWSKPPAGVRVQNAAFETVPPRLIGHVVFEDCIVDSRGVRPVWRRVSKGRAATLGQRRRKRSTHRR